MVTSLHAASWPVQELLRDVKCARRSLGRRGQRLAFLDDVHRVQFDGFIKRPFIVNGAVGNCQSLARMHNLLRLAIALEPEIAFDDLSHHNAGMVMTPGLGTGGDLDGRIDELKVGRLIGLAVILAGSILLAPLAAEAQETGKVARIGFLGLNPGASPHLREAFLQGLRDLGYVEGRTVVIEYRSAEGKPERFPALAAELIALKVDVIVTGGGTPTALAAKQATRTIPIVFASAPDPVADGLITSLARPGGNITGLSNLTPELVGKRLEQLKQAVPRVSRVAVLWQPGALGERTEKDILKGAEVAARALGVRLQFVEARGPADIDRAFSEMIRARAGALTVLGSAMLFSERRRLVDLAAKHRLPAVYTSRDIVDAGGLMSYGPNLADNFRRAAIYVDKILRGTKPGDLPVEQPTKFELVINLKTAKALGLTIPQSLLLQADEVIQ